MKQHSHAVDVAEFASAWKHSAISDISEIFGRNREISYKMAPIFDFIDQKA